MFTISFLGLPLLAWGGIFLFVLLSVQLLTGLRLIKTKPNFHKYLGISIFVVVLFHMAMGLTYLLG